MKTKNIINAVALAALLGAALTLSERCAVAQATQTTVVRSTEAQSATEPTAGTVKKKTAQVIASADRSTTPPAQKTALVTPSSTSKVGASERDSTDPQAAAPAPSADDAAELAKKLSNPLASMISFPMQSNFDMRMGTGSGWKYTLNMQPVIPIALNPKWNLISRTIIPIIHQSNVTAPGASQSGLGDITQSLFFSPNKSEPFIWGVGPVILLPTATNKFLGAQKLGLGPTIVVLKQQHGWTVGTLANHIWSVAGKSNRANVNATFIQPFLSYGTKDGWTYGVNTESSYNWLAHNWAVPIHVTVQKLVRFGKQPIAFQGGLRCWATSPGGGPEGCGLRFVVTALFPKK